MKKVRTYTFWARKKNETQECTYNLNATSIKEVKEYCKQHDIVVCDKISRL